MNYPLAKDDWKKFEKNNPKIALNVLRVKEMNIFQNTIYIMKNKSFF